MKCVDSIFLFSQKIFRFLIKFVCPPIFLLLYSKQTEYTYYKLICGFLYGVMLGLGFYELILVDLNFTDNVAISTGAILCLLLGFGNAFSAQIRCIALLTFPCFCGRAGRGVLKALVLAYIISGPIQNLSNNGREVVRVFACTTSLTYNLTKTRFELMFKPFQSALLGMKTDVNEIKDTMRSIRDVSAPIVQEMENEAEMRKLKEENDYIDQLQQDSKRSDDIEKKYDTSNTHDEGEKYERNYLKKLEYRCEDQLSRGASKCRKHFEKSYNYCYNKVSWIGAWLLCWPMKLTFVCNIVEAMGGSKVCDPSKEMDPGVGDGYAYLKRSKTTLNENFKDVKLQYKIGKMPPLVEVHQAADTAKAVLHTFKAKKTILDTFLLIIKRVLAFVFLRIIISAQNYHDAYLRRIQHDNFYITRYFRKIDARRHSREQRTLLPLKKVERAKLIDPVSLIPLEKEREKLIGETFKLLLEMITATTFLLLDRLFYEALDLVRRHAHIEYEQTGHHDMNLEVRGTGMIAALLRSVVRGFNIKKRIKIVRSNAACLPQPSLMPNYYLHKIYGSYLMVWLLLVAQAYTQRLRHVICGYFYRRREKERVLHLYNETLKRRVGFFKHMRKKVVKMVREQKLQEDLNVFAVLRVRFPIAFFWLRCFSAARRKCIICGDPEPRWEKKNRRFLRCGNEDCYVVYCSECWLDIDYQCLACGPPSHLDTSGTDETDSGVALDDED